MREEFTHVYVNIIQRSGADKLLDWIENRTDFFDAPASTRYHLAEPGGLVKHSVHVFERLNALCESEDWAAKGTFQTAERVDSDLRASPRPVQGKFLQGFYPQRQKRGDRSVGEGAVLHCRGPVSLRPR